MAPDPKRGEESAGGLRDATLRLAKAFASPGPPTAGSAAAATGAVAAGLLQWAAAVNARRGPRAFRRRARGIGQRAAALQESLSAAGQADATAVAGWLRAGPEAGPEACYGATDSVLDIASRCTQVTTLAGEVARDGYAPVHADVAALRRLAAAAAECALDLAEANLVETLDAERARAARRRIGRVRTELRRAGPAAAEPGPS